jgi:eukaryotic-like serine/threonine-protein kinase
MINENASVATELELPSTSEGTPPLLLERVSGRPAASIAGAGRIAASPLLEASTKQADASRRELPHPPTLVIGDIVADRYRVGHVIGAGGMGIVYKAQHVELGTSVAIKVIRPDIAQNSSLWRRFAREARALAALHNKNVVRVHDAGTLPSGLRYLVMELLDGTDLRRLLLDRGSLPIAEAVDYALQVCSALGDAHRLNIIHRDIKPENIFLAHFRVCEPTIKLLDFGVARFLDDKGQLTVPGRGVGSPRYLSPEQLLNPGSVAQGSDIWGVGLLLYELISGRSPFHGMNTAQICLSICQGSFPSITTLRPDLPPALCAAVMHCLEPDPKRRFQSADELSAALEPFSGRHVRSPKTPIPPSVEAPSPTPKVPRTKRRRAAKQAVAPKPDPAQAEATKTIAKNTKGSPWSGFMPRWARAHGT